MGYEEEEAQVRPETDNSKRKLEEIQLAKQRAQEIVARLVNDAETKRPRLDSSDSVIAHPPPFPFPDVAENPSSQLTVNLQVGMTPPSVQPGSYFGFQGTTKRIAIPNGKVGVIIGKGGETIKYFQLQSGARIQITKDTEADPYSQTRDVELTGTPEQISRAEQLVKDVISETDAGGSGHSATRGFNSVPYGAEQFTMKVPNNKVALIIGKGGESIKNMQSRSGARIQVIPLHLPPGDTSTERTVHIIGTKEQIESAKELVNEVISENRVRNLSMPSSYMQHSYHPPGNWGPPGPPPMQQPEYGYAQPGTYPTHPQPYYGSYPLQPAGWDQSNPTAMFQTPQQSTGYNYYGQQDQSESAQVNVSYGYGQTPPATSHNHDQGYSQQPQSYGQDTPAQPPENDEQKPYSTPGYEPPATSSQLDGTALSQPYEIQSSTQPPHPVTYSQPLAVPPSGYGPSQSYAGASSQPGYDQTGYNQSGYGGQPPAQIPLPTSHLVYGQGGYPPQLPPAQSSYVHGYSESLAYGAGDGNTTTSYGSAPPMQEAVRPQS